MISVDLGDDTCDDILHPKLLTYFQYPVPLSGSAKRRACVEPVQPTGDPMLIDSSTAADRAPTKQIADHGSNLIVVPTPEKSACATGVSAAARRKTRKRACPDSAILRPRKRPTRDRLESITAVRFAHSCPPDCGEEAPPDGEQSDDETHQARHGRCAKLAKVRRVIPDVKFVRTSTSAHGVHLSCSSLICSTALLSHTMEVHSPGLRNARDLGGEVGAWAVFCATI